MSAGSRNGRGGNGDDHDMSQKEDPVKELEKAHRHWEDIYEMRMVVLILHGLMERI